MNLWEFYKSKRPRHYCDNWHLRWICSVLERAYTERKNVILECPPRHSKSELVNVYGPAWRLGEVFDENFMLITNSNNLASKFSVATRNLITVPLCEERDSQWKIAGTDSLNYSYFAAGLRGQMTGHGASVLVLDDTLKSGAEAKSDQIREGTWDNVCSAAINRLSPEGIIIGLQARLHQQDTIGKLLALDHLKFLHLHLPATNDSGKEAFFRDGYSGEETIFPEYDALWPERYDRAKLDEIRATVSSYYWNSQYMAQPSMGELGYFDVDRMPRYQHPVGIQRCWMAVDAANTATVNGSYTALVGLGFDGIGLKVLNVRRGRWRADEMGEQVVQFYQGLFRQVGIVPEAVVIEQAAGGYGLIDRLTGQLPVIAVYPKGSKEERAGGVCYIVNQGQCSVPESAPWLKIFLEELQNFPLCASKDMTDAFVHALSYIFRASEFKHQEVELGGFVYNAIEAASFEDDGPTLSNDIPWFGVY